MTEQQLWGEYPGALVGSNLSWLWQQQGSDSSPGAEPVV